MSDLQNKPSKGAQLWDWINDRFPVTETWDRHIGKYYAPKNFNWLYVMGFLALLVLVIQLVSGFYLTMSYKPDALKAFDSVEYIMRDVEYGWLLRYLHSTGASAFFIVVYLHMFRGLVYGSYRTPRELVWLIGMGIYLVMMAEAFLGYLLPWGQMSFWGAQVIVNLFDAVPVIGPGLAEWIRGDFVISDITLNRFFAFHVFLMPLLLIAFIYLHIVALHAKKVGSNNPDGIEVKKNLDESGVPRDGVPFHPYMTTKDFIAGGIFMFLFLWVVFYAPEGGGYFLEPPNFEQANSLKTPDHIAPVWYFTPFYAMLRAIPSIAGSTFPSVLVMGGGILIWAFLPWLDRSPVKSIRYKGILSRIAVICFVISFVVLGVLGTLPATGIYTPLAQFFTLVYFAYFLLMPFYTRWERCKTPPERVTG